MKTLLIALLLPFVGHAEDFFRCYDYAIETLPDGTYQSSLHNRAEIKLQKIDGKCKVTTKDRVGVHEFVYDPVRFKFRLTDPSEMPEIFRDCDVNYPMRDKLAKCNLNAPMLPLDTGDGPYTCYYIDSPRTASAAEMKFKVRDDKSKNICLSYTECKLFGSIPYSPDRAKEGFTYVACLPDSAGKCTKDYKACRDDNDLTAAPDYSEGNIHWFLNSEPETAQ